MIIGYQYLYSLFYNLLYISYMSSMYPLVGRRLRRPSAIKNARLFIKRGIILGNFLSYHHDLLYSPRHADSAGRRSLSRGQAELGLVPKPLNVYLSAGLFYYIHTGALFG